MLTDKRLCNGWLLDLAGGTFLLDCDPFVQPPDTWVNMYDLTGVSYRRKLGLPAGRICEMLKDAFYRLTPPVGWEPCDDHQRGVIE